MSEFENAKTSPGSSARLGPLSFVLYSRSLLFLLSFLSNRHICLTPWDIYACRYCCVWHHGLGVESKAPEFRPTGGGVESWLPSLPAGRLWVLIHCVPQFPHLVKWNP